MALMIYTLNCTNNISLFFSFLPSRPIVDDGSVSTTAVRHHCDYYCSLSVFYALGSNPEIHSVSGDSRGQIAQRKMIA